MNNTSNILPSNDLHAEVFLRNLQERDRELRIQQQRLATANPNNNRRVGAGYIASDRSMIDNQIATEITRPDRKKSH